MYSPSLLQHYLVYFLVGPGTRRSLESAESKGPEEHLETAYEAHIITAGTSPPRSELSRPNVLYTLN